MIEQITPVKYLRDAWQVRPISFGIFYFNFYSVLCLLIFACTSATMRQIILTLQFCKIYGDQMICILGFLAVGKKYFIKVLFFSTLSLERSLSHSYRTYWVRQEVAVHVEHCIYFSKSHFFAGYVFWGGVLTRCSPVSKWNISIPRFVWGWGIPTKLCEVLKYPIYHVLIHVSSTEKDWKLIIQSPEEHSLISVSILSCGNLNLSCCIWKPVSSCH